MIDQQITVNIFKASWAILLAIAVAAQVRFKGKIKQKGGFLDTLLVVAPYWVVFGWFSVREVVGTYQGNIGLQLVGMAGLVAGIIGYVVSICHLRKNWTVSAAIKEGHTLVKEGPYRFVRHPMYFFMILAMLGSGLLISDFMIIGYVPLVAFLYYLRAKKEEKMLVKALPDYESYAKETRMLVPWVL